MIEEVKETNPIDIKVTKFRKFKYGYQMVRYKIRKQNELKDPLIIITIILKNASAVTAKAFNWDG
jgi:hypothetical protein